MIYILLTIVIIIIILLDFYLNIYTNKEIIIIDNPNPWNKICIYKNYSEYYINIDNIDESIDNKLTEFNKITNEIKYDKKTNNLIIRTKTDFEALILTNLFISTINNELDINDIIENDLINKTNNKSANKSVKKKLIQLIKNGLKSNTNVTENFEDKYIYHDTNNNKIISHLINTDVLPVNNNIDMPDTPIINNEPINETMSNNIINETDKNNIINEPIQKSYLTPYGGNEYATFNF